MQIDHDALVMVVDGRKMLMFRNQGDEVYPNLEVEHAVEQPNPSDGAQSSDAAGRASSPVGGRQSAIEKTDYHQQAEDRFAAEAAGELKRRAFANDYARLIVVAPPQTLGELRKHYHKEVQSRLVGELGKDLASHPVAEIEKILLAA